MKSRCMYEVPLPPMLHTISLFRFIVQNIVEIHNTFICRSHSVFFNSLNCPSMHFILYYAIYIFDWRLEEFLFVMKMCCIKLSNAINNGRFTALSKTKNIFQWQMVLLMLLYWPRNAKPCFVSYRVKLLLWWLKSSQYIYNKYIKWRDHWCSDCSMFKHQAHFNRVSWCDQMPIKV